MKKSEYLDHVLSAIENMCIAEYRPLDYQNKQSLYVDKPLYDMIYNHDDHKCLQTNLEKYKIFDDFMENAIKGNSNIHIDYFVANQPSIALTRSIEDNIKEHEIFYDTLGLCNHC